MGVFLKLTLYPWVRACFICIFVMFLGLTGCKQKPAPLVYTHPNSNQQIPLDPETKAVQTSDMAPNPETTHIDKQTVTTDKQTTSIGKTNNTNSTQTSGNHKQLSLSQLIQKYPVYFVRIGSNKQKRVALTFDDAPDDIFTPQVLDILKKNQVKATFFVVGERVKKYPEMMKRIVSEGHALGNHSYNHSLLTKLSFSKFKTQITDTQSIIKKYTGYSPKYMRPPYGELNEEQLNWLIDQGITAVFWSVDSQDWRQKTAQQVVANVMKDISPGAIVLQHSGGGVGQDLSGTVEALPIIISKLKAKNYEFVTIPELLDKK